MITFGLLVVCVMLVIVVVMLAVTCLDLLRPLEVTCDRCSQRSGFERECDVLRDRYIALRDVFEIGDPQVEDAYRTYINAAKVLENYRLR